MRKGKKTKGQLPGASVSVSFSYKLSKLENTIMQTVLWMLLISVGLVLLFNLVSAPEILINAATICLVISFILMFGLFVYCTVQAFRGTHGEDES